MEILEAIKYFILGLVQGITEVLPVSSSGHVELFKAMLNMEIDEGLLFLILVNSGSLLTLLFVYRKKLIVLIVDFFRYIFKPESREETKRNFIYVIKLLIATVPAAIVGILFSHFFDYLITEYSVLASGIGLVFTGSVLILLSLNRFRNGATEISYVDAILMGVAQSVALFPGISRSGMTTSTAIKKGVGINSALDFSFLMYIPVSLGSMVMLITEGFEEGFSVPSNYYFFYYALAFVGALGATYLAFKIIFRAFRSRKLKYFGYYCLVAGLISIGIYIF